MFTEDEASSMLVAGKLVEKMADKSVRAAFESAMHKIKAVLNEAGKDHLQNLESHIEIFLRSKYEVRESKDFPDHFMTEIQRAVAKKEVMRIDYCNTEGELTQREVEPIGIFYYSMAWHLIAWCRLRNGYRDFRADRIKALLSTGEHFEGRNLISLKEYFQSMFQSNKDLIKVIVTFDKSSLRGRPIYGSISLTDIGDRVRAEFLMDSLPQIARWLLMFGTAAEIEEPEELKTIMAELVEEMYVHYSAAVIPEVPFK
jgi:predicted DNA-binding transcriptional regulator YafY